MIRHPSGSCLLTYARGYQSTEKAVRAVAATLRPEKYDGSTLPTMEQCEGFQRK